MRSHRLRLRRNRRPADRPDTASAELDMASAVEAHHNRASPVVAASHSQACRAVPFHNRACPVEAHRRDNLAEASHSLAFQVVAFQVVAFQVVAFQVVASRMDRAAAVSAGHSPASPEIRVAADTPVAVLVVAGLLPEFLLPEFLLPEFLLPEFLLPEFLLPVVQVLVQMPQPRRDQQGLSCRR